MASEPDETGLDDLEVDGTVVLKNEPNVIPLADVKDLGPGGGADATQFNRVDIIGDGESPAIQQSDEESNGLLIALGVSIGILVIALAVVCALWLRSRILKEKQEDKLIEAAIKRETAGRLDAAGFSQTVGVLEVAESAADTTDETMSVTTTDQSQSPAPTDTQISLNSQQQPFHKAQYGYESYPAEPGIRIPSQRLPSAPFGYGYYAADPEIQISSQPQSLKSTQPYKQQAHIEGRQFQTSGVDTQSPPGAPPQYPRPLSQALPSLSFQLLPPPPSLQGQAFYADSSVNSQYPALPVLAYENETASSGTRILPAEYVTRLSRLSGPVTGIQPETAEGMLIESRPKSPSQRGCESRQQSSSQKGPDSKAQSYSQQLPASNPTSKPASLIPFSSRHSLSPSLSSPSPQPSQIKPASDMSETGKTSEAARSTDPIRNTSTGTGSRMHEGVNTSLGTASRQASRVDVARDYDSLPAPKSPSYHPDCSPSPPSEKSGTASSSRRFPETDRQSLPPTRQQAVQTQNISYETDTTSATSNDVRGRPVGIHSDSASEDWDFRRQSRGMVAQLKRKFSDYARRYGKLHAPRYPYPYSSPSPPRRAKYHDRDTTPEYWTPAINKRYKWKHSPIDRSDNIPLEFTHPDEQKVFKLGRKFSAYARENGKFPVQKYPYYYHSSPSPKRRGKEKAGRTSSKHKSGDRNLMSKPALFDNGECVPSVSHTLSDEQAVFKLGRKFSAYARDYGKMPVPEYSYYHLSPSPPRRGRGKARRTSPKHQRNSDDESPSFDGENICVEHWNYTLPAEQNVTSLKRKYSAYVRERGQLPAPQYPGYYQCSRPPSPTSNEDELSLPQEWDFKRPLERKVSHLKRQFNSYAAKCRKLPRPEYPYYPLSSSSSPSPPRKPEGQRGRSPNTTESKFWCASDSKIKVLPKTSGDKSRNQSQKLSSTSTSSLQLRAPKRDDVKLKVALPKRSITSRNYIADVVATSFLSKANSRGLNSKVMPHLAPEPVNKALHEASRNQRVPGNNCTLDAQQRASGVQSSPETQGHQPGPLPERSHSWLDHAHIRSVNSLRNMFDDNKVIFKPRPRRAAGQRMSMLTGNSDSKVERQPSFSDGFSSAVNTNTEKKVSDRSWVSRGARNVNESGRRRVSFHSDESDPTDLSTTVY